MGAVAELVDATRRLFANTGLLLGVLNLLSNTFRVKVRVKIRAGYGSVAPTI